MGAEGIDGVEAALVTDLVMKGYLEVEAVDVLVEVEYVGLDGALAAGSWAARRWLGHPDALTDGAPADFVVLDSDPRRDLRVLQTPRFVVLRGRVVESR